MYYIYRITNNINGNTYIGQHKYKYINDSYMGSGKILKQAFNKYGKENFTKEILYSRILNKETADSIEIFAIKKERSIGKAEYNIADGGQGGHIVIKGTKLYEQWTKHLSEAMKGYVPTAEHRKHLSEALKGKPKSKEHIIKHADAIRGKKLSEEHKRKISEARKGAPSNTKGKRWKLVNGKRFYYEEK